MAIEELEQALAIDPLFTAAWVDDSYVRGLAQYYDPQRGDEHRARSEEAARRAIELDPHLGEAYAALGAVLWTKRDWTGAEAALRMAHDLNVPMARMSEYAMLQLAVGKFASARDLLEKNRAADPQNPIYYRFLMHANSALGEWAAAKDLYESGVRVFVPWREGPIQRMHWLVGRNDLAAARAIPLDDPFNAAMLASADAPAAALAELRRANDELGTGHPNRRRDVALWAGHFGDARLAFEAMRAAIDEQGGQAVYVWYPQLAPMRRLPEFEQYLHEIGMVSYWQEYGWPALCRPLEDELECD